MRGIARLAGLTLLVALGLTQTASAYPKPSPYPVSWELKFVHSEPRRVVVEVPGAPLPKAYWFITYTVTNNTERDVEFLPEFLMVSKNGTVKRSDRVVPRVVFDKIKSATNNKLLESALKVAGTLHVGEDQARDGVAIWEEPEVRMGSFTIFVTGLSGESTPLTDDAGAPLNDKDNRPILLFKTLQLDFNISGDELYAGDPVDQTGKQWIMR
ncbi:MAG TPA: hypothetical protein VF624_08535 [Tepidisphaeraceae bacterium]|jgi:hypothetical protein